MSERKAVTEAKARLAAIDARVKEIKDAQAERERKAAPARKRLDALRKRQGKRNAIMSRPAGEFLILSDGLAAFSLGWTSREDKRTAAQVTKVILDGEKVTLAGSGIQMSARGVAAKIRFVDTATRNRISRLDAAATLAEQKARAARKAWADAKRDAWEASSDRPTPEAIAEVIGQVTAIKKTIPYTGMMDSYTLERIENYERPAAVKALEEAKKGAVKAA